MGRKKTEINDALIHAASVVGAVECNEAAIF